MQSELQYFIYPQTFGHTVATRHWQYAAQAVWRHLMYIFYFNGAEKSLVTLTTIVREAVVTNLLCLRWPYQLTWQSVHNKYIFNVWLYCPQLPGNTRWDGACPSHYCGLFIWWSSDNRAIVHVAYCLVIYYLTREANLSVSQAYSSSSTCLPFVRRLTAKCTTTGGSQNTDTVRRSKTT